MNHKPAREDSCRVDPIVSVSRETDGACVHFYDGTEERLYTTRKDLSIAESLEQLMASVISKTCRLLSDDTTLDQILAAVESIQRQSWSFTSTLHTTLSDLSHDMRLALFQLDAMIRGVVKMRTSDEWQSRLSELFTILDPDGWPRDDGFNLAWYEDRITLERWLDKMVISTTQTSEVGRLYMRCLVFSNFNKENLS